MQDFIYNPPLYPYIDLIYQDDDIAVVNKPSGLLSVPGRLPQNHDSIISRLGSLGLNAMSVHRLDMDTSGLMVAALSKTAVSSLGRQFISKDVKKCYLALVDGKLTVKGSVDLPIRCDLEHRPLQIVDFDFGKPSLTLYEKASFDYSADTGYDASLSTLVKLTPVTGRSHQLRVHMQQIGHPILGDRFYADEKTLKKAKRLCLHAAFLSFLHPKTQQRMEFSSFPDFIVSEYRGPF